MRVAAKAHPAVCGVPCVCCQVRVIQQKQGERNFHAFYQLCKAANQQERKKYCVGDPGDYNYLAMSQCIDVDTIDDVEGWCALRAMPASESRGQISRR